MLKIITAIICVNINVAAYAESIIRKLQWSPTGIARGTYYPLIALICDIPPKHHSHSSTGKTRGLLRRRIKERTLSL